MKTKQFLFFLAFISFTATIAQKDNLQKDLKIYEQVWDNIINNGHIDLISNKNFDTNITLISFPENIIGIEDFKAYYQNYLTGFSEIKFNVVKVFGQDDNIVKHWNFTGKHTGDFFGIPATGNLVNVEGVTLVKMKNGKIAQEQDFKTQRIKM